MAWIIIALAAHIFPIFFSHLQRLLLVLFFPFVRAHSLLLFRVIFAHFLCIVTRNFVRICLMLQSQMGLCANYRAQALHPLDPCMFWISSGKNLSGFFPILTDCTRLQLQWFAVAWFSPQPFSNLFSFNIQWEALCLSPVRVLPFIKFLTGNYVYFVHRYTHAHSLTSHITQNNSLACCYHSHNRFSSSTNKCSSSSFSPRTHIYISMFGACLNTLENRKIY